MLLKKSSKFFSANNMKQRYFFDKVWCLMHCSRTKYRFSLHFSVDKIYMPLLVFMAHRYSGFHLMTHDSCFIILVKVFRNNISLVSQDLRNHIDQTERKIMVLKPKNKCQVIWHGHSFRNILNEDFQHHPFLFCGAEKN